MLKLGSTKRFRKMCEEEPVTEDIDDGMKYGPSREDLCRIWEDSGGADWGKVAEADSMKEKMTLIKAAKKKPHMKKNKEQSKKARTARLTFVLSQLCHSHDKKDLTIWKQSCGRFVAQKLGPVIYLKNKGFIRKLSGHGRLRKGEHLVDLRKVGAQGQWAVIPQKNMTNTKVEEMVEMSIAGEKQMQKCPTSVAQVEVDIIIIYKI